MKLVLLLLLLLGSLQGVFTQVVTPAFTERTAVEEGLGSGKRRTWFFYDWTKCLNKAARLLLQIVRHIVHWKLVKDAWIWALKNALCCLGLLEVEQEDELADTYWSGTAPICFGGCKGRQRELKRDNCGDSDCCWVGFKSLCRGTPDRHLKGTVHTHSVIIYPPL